MLDLLEFHFFFFNFYKSTCLHPWPTPIIILIPLTLLWSENQEGTADFGGVGPNACKYNI